MNYFFRKSCGEDEAGGNRHSVGERAGGGQFYARPLWRSCGDVDLFFDAENYERVKRDIFENGGVRVWRNDGVDVLLPSLDNDVMIVFTHFLQHFFVGGVGLQQICDWCRLLWTYRDSIDRGLLERRRTKAVVGKS